MMRGTMVIIKPGGQQDATEFTRAPTLEELQAAVGGGYIEMVPHFVLLPDTIRSNPTRCVAYCNEDGKGLGLETNLLATAMWMASCAATIGRLTDDYLAGPVVVLFGDAEFMEAL